MSLQKTIILIAFIAKILNMPSIAASEESGDPILYDKIEIPQHLLSESGFGGDIRIGDLDGDGYADYVVYRSADNALKPCFIGAFKRNGEILWKAGSGGDQPARPGPVAVHDFDGDGAAEVLCFFIDSSVLPGRNSMANVVVQLRDGKNGSILRQNAPEEMRRCSGEGANWVHQRLLIADLRGSETPGDFIVKLGSELLAFDDKLNILWTYSIKWNEYSYCSAYIPSVGDIDGDGRDEINGGFYLLDDDGTPRWEGQIARHMDSVAIVPWDNENIRAVCSGYGHVLDFDGNAILRLGEQFVPHGQEVRVADFDRNLPGPEMIIRYDGHFPDVMFVANDLSIIKRYKINTSPNNTGMEPVQWFGANGPALLYNGGMLWYGDGRLFSELPELPEPTWGERMGWFHCIPANVCGDDREELVLYNPWEPCIRIYTPEPFVEDMYEGYRPGPRQYNVRLMD